MKCLSKMASNISCNIGVDGLAIGFESIYHEFQLFAFGLSMKFKRVHCNLMTLEGF